MTPLDTRVPNAAWLHVILGLLLVVITGGVYWQVHAFELLNNDDLKYISMNPRIPLGITWVNVTWAFTTGYFSNWHPLTWLSYFGDAEMYGMYPGGFHSTNLQFHLLATLLLFLALSRMTRQVWPAAMTAFLFALHPLHVESVAWVSERKDVLSGAFMMLALLAYAWYVERPGLLRYIPLFLAYAFGLMSKPMLVTLPFVLILLDYWPLDRFKSSSIARCVLEKIPLFAATIASSAVTYLVQRQGGAMEKYDTLALPYRLANAALAYVAYLGKTFWPVNLAPFYPHPGANVSWTLATLAALLLLTITIAALVLRRRYPFLLVGWLWYLGMLVPVIGLVQVGAQGMADRYTYLPIIGIFIGLVWLLADWGGQEPRRQRILLAATGVIVVVLCAATSWQTGHWRNGVTLYSHAVNVTPDNPVAHNLYGNALALRGRTRAALPHFEIALRLDPGYANAHFGLAMAQQELGDLVSAAAHYEATLRLEPEQITARYKLGQTLFLQRKYDEAANAFQAVIDEEPRYVDAYNGLGMTFAARGRFQEAMRAYGEALRLRPEYLDALLNLAVAMVNSGQAERALEPLQEALRIAPGYAPAQFYLGLVHERLGHTDQARAHLQQALRLDPSLAPAHFALERMDLLQ